MRCLTPFILLGMVIVLALAGYNWWQIVGMREDLAGIKEKVYKGNLTNDGKEDLLTALASSKHHAQRAKEYMSKGQNARARAELDYCLRKLDSASVLSREIAVGAGRGLGETLSGIRKQMENAWNELSTHRDYILNPGGKPPAREE